MPYLFLAWRGRSEKVTEQVLQYRNIGTKKKDHDKMVEDTLKSHHSMAFDLLTLPQNLHRTVEKQTLRSLSCFITVFSSSLQFRDIRKPVVTGCVYPKLCQQRFTKGVFKGESRLSPRVRIGHQYGETEIQTKFCQFYLNWQKFKQNNGPISGKFLHEDNEASFNEKKRSQFLNKKKIAFQGTTSGGDEYLPGWNRQWSANRTVSCLMVGKACSNCGENNLFARVCQSSKTPDNMMFLQGVN